MLGTVLLFIIVVSAIWSAADSSMHHVSIGSHKEYNGSAPVLWLICCLLLWFIAFPFYLIRRADTLRVAAISGGFQGSASLAAPITAGASASGPVAALRGPSRYCATCGVQLSATAAFCSRCGCQQPSL